MIPIEIIEDLKAGEDLEDTLIKHGTNLKELFSPGKKNSSSKCNEWTYIRFTKSNSFRIVKFIGTHDVQFGTYKTHDDALKVRNELIKCGWDKKQLQDIYEKTGVIPNKSRGIKKCISKQT